MDRNRRFKTILLVGVLLTALAIIAFAAPVSSQEDTSGITVTQPGETVEGDIQTFEQWDIYSFDAEAGQPLRFEVSRTGGTGELLFMVADSTGNGLTWNSVGSDDTLELLFVPAATGTHYALMAADTPNAAGPYSLTLPADTAIDEPHGDTIEIPDSTDVSDDAIRPLRSDMMLSGEINGINDFEMFSQEASAGDQITLEFTRHGGAGTFGVALVDAEGQILTSDAVGSGTSLTLSAPVPRDGTYSVLVIGTTYDAIGPYSLTSFDEEPREPPAEQLPDTVISNTMKMQVQALATDRSIGSGIYGVDEHDLYTVEAVTNESISVAIDRFTGNGTFAVGLVSPEREVLAADFVSSTETTTLSATATQSGTYFVLVVGATENASGDYTITLLDESVNERLDASDGESRSIQPSETLEGELDGIDDFGVFNLNTTAGEVITAELTREGGGGEFAVAIVDFDGNILAVDVAAPNGTVSISAIAEQDGLYSVVVVGVDADASGPYSITLVGDVSSEAAELLSVT